MIGIISINTRTLSRLSPILKLYSDKEFENAIIFIKEAWSNSRRIYCNWGSLCLQKKFMILFDLENILEIHIHGVTDINAIWL